MIALPPVTRIAGAGGVGLAVYDAGGPSGLPPVVLLHGFPEIAFSWRHQLAALPGLGVRALAPDQRGYGASDRPSAVEAYDIVALTGDVAALLDHYGFEKAVICGHDWGGLVAWAFAARRPDRTAGVIGVNTPYTRRAPIDPIALYRQRFGEEFYIVRFQTPDAPEALLEADLDATFGALMRRPDPAGRAAGPLAAISGFDPDADPLQLLTREERAVYVAAFAASGFRGPINWYRNFSRNWALSADVADRVEAASLMVTAELDPVLPPSAAEGMEKYVPNLTRRMIAGCGHWTPQEKPAELTALIAGWMGATFGPAPPGALARPPASP